MAEWVLSSLGFLPGGTRSYGIAVSGDGSVIAGNATTSGINQQRACRWTTAGIEMLDLLPGTVALSATYQVYDCSYDGSIVVGSGKNSNANPTEPLRWTASGLESLGSLGGTVGEAIGCSSDGSVVVGYSNNGSGQARIFRWTSGSGLVDLGTLGGSTTGNRARGCSDDGSVVVGVSRVSGTNFQHAFLWTEAGGMVDLGTLGGVFSDAVACSSDGAVVVGTSSDGAGVTRAFRWTAADGMEALDALPGATAYGVKGCSSDGSIVVGYSTVSGNTRGTVWTDGVAVDIGDLGDATTTYVSSCSTDGALIAGWSSAADGNLTAYSAVAIPTPDPPPPNNGATIVFEPLVSSPQTFGDAAAPLSALTAYGQEGAGAYGIVYLPLLSVTAQGNTQDAVFGTGVAQLPGLEILAGNATVGIVATYTANGFLVLPAVKVAARDGTALVPQSGWGSFDLPGLGLLAGGGDSKWGSGVAALPPMQAFAYDTAGAHGVAILPAPVASGAQTATAAANRMLLVQSPGIMSLFASNEFSVILGNDVSFSQATTAVPVKTLSAGVRMTGAPRGLLTTGVDVADGIGFGGVLTVVWQTLIEENLSLIGEAAGQPTKIVRLADSLVASGAVATHTEAFAALAAALAINSLTATGWRAEAADSLGLQGAFQAQLIAAARLLDSMAISDAVSPSMRLTALLGDTMATGDAVQPSLQYLESLGEDVLFFGAIRLGADEYVGWVLNGGAASEYRNYPFNGFAQFGGRYYGTADDGLYLLEGDDDAGEPIEASIKTALMDFGTGVLKRIPDMYVAFAGGDSLLVKVITTGQRGEQVETIYTAAVPAGDALHNVPVRIGQGLKSRYWQFELTNVDGDAFEVDELAWRPMTLDRRL